MSLLKGQNVIVKYIRDIEVVENTVSINPLLISIDQFVIGTADNEGGGNRGSFDRPGSC